jgi:hypothetical protein
MVVVAMINLFPSYLGLCFTVLPVDMDIGYGNRALHRGPRSSVSLLTLLS